jgi:hypothetical protein|tara:strand:+ start:7774 stop:8313 length:540 start_codon:yes stop_codon:yes gene_type:complete
MRLKVGDILVFKRKGKTAAVLSLLIKVFEPKWDRWGWHTAIVTSVNRAGDIWIIEGTSPKSTGRELEEGENVRVYRVFTELDRDKTFNRDMHITVISHINKPYDVAIYFWTALQYTIRHFFNHRIPRLLDDRYTCWELVCSICRDLDKPINSKYNCPMLPDILKAIGNTFVTEYGKEKE